MAVIYASSKITQMAFLSANNNLEDVCPHYECWLVLNGHTFGIAADVQSTLVISNSKGLTETFEISVPRHIRV